jgi:heat shock protein HspQ
MSSQIANISLYIPHVFANISKKMVAETFENLRIGSVKRVDFVHKRGSNGDFNAVYIHFNHWYDNVAAHNFQERVISPSMEARIVYDEPWYWIVLENKTKKVDSTKRKPRLNLEALANSGYVTPPVKQMTNQDFANLLQNSCQDLIKSSLEEDEEDFRALCRDISSEICYAEEDAAIITMDDVIDENRKLKEQLGEYMEKAGRLEHQFNMLMDDKISVSNELAWLKEQAYNNV